MDYVSFLLGTDETLENGRKEANESRLLLLPLLLDCFSYNRSKLSFVRFLCASSGSDI